MKHSRLIVLTVLILVSSAFYAMPLTLAESVEPAGFELYKDVPVSDTHFQNIAEARTLRMMTGYPDNRFQPYQKLTRANVVKVLGKYVEQRTGHSVEELDLSDVEPFADVGPDYQDSELYRYSLLVKREGIFKGSENRLMPQNLIQRQQIAQVLVRAFGLQDLPDAQSKITDNKKAFSEAERNAINILSKNRVTSVQEFRPVETTVRGQLASFLIASYHAVHGEYPPPKVVSIEIDAVVEPAATGE